MARIKLVADCDSSSFRSPLDQNAVDSYLEKHVAGFAAPSDIKQFSFGQS